MRSKRAPRSPSPASATATLTPSRRRARELNDRRGYSSPRPRSSGAVRQRGDSVTWTAAASAQQPIIRTAAVMLALQPAACDRRASGFYCHTRRVASSIGASCPPSRAARCASPRALDNQCGGLVSAELHVPTSEATADVCPRGFFIAGDCFFAVLFGVDLLEVLIHDAIIFIWGLRCSVIQRLGQSPAASIALISMPDTYNRVVVGKRLVLVVILIRDLHLERTRFSYGFSSATFSFSPTAPSCDNFSAAFFSFLNAFSACSFAILLRIAQRQIRNRQVLAPLEACLGPISFTLIASSILSVIRL